MALSSTQRQYLRREAHALRPIVQVGKNGLSDAIIDGTAQALESHELIKVKFMDAPEERKALAQELAENVMAELVAVVGNIAILYRQSSDPDKQRVQLPRR